MCLYAPTSDFDSLEGGCVVALGCFDGLHVGHRQLLSFAKAEARARNLPLVVYSPESRKGQAYLTTPEEKKRLLYDFGADRVILADFDRIKDLDAEQFVFRILLGKLFCRVAVCGYNFRFGRFAAGDSDCLARLLRASGADTVVLPAVTADGEDVSSTRIRNLLLNGKTERANRLLTVPYSVTGKVCHGRQIGRTLGFPTANIPFPDGKIIPKHGVYYCRVETSNGVFGAVANIGVRPTFKDSPALPLLEVHLLHFEGDLYESEIRVSLVTFLRPEMKFSEPSALSCAVHLDMESAARLAASDPILTKETI